MKKLKVATVWLDGCSGCHMSLLDMDAAIISLAQKIELVYGPLVDAQEFPEDVDVTLVEGAVSSQDDLNKIQKIRQRTHLLVAMGDCAVTGNVPAMRNSIPVTRMLQCVYASGGEARPSRAKAFLCCSSRPAPSASSSQWTFRLPGCPPPSKSIAGVIAALLEGKKTESAAGVKFG